MLNTISFFYRLRIFFLLIYLFFYTSSSYAILSSSSSCERLIPVALCHKIGQMMIVGFGGMNQDENGQILWEDPDSAEFKPHSNIGKAINKYHIGGVILFTQSFRNKRNSVFIRDRNIQNPAQLKKLNADLQNYSKETRAIQHLSPLPLFITVDQEGGMVNRLPAELGFPQTTIVPQALGDNEEQMKVAGKNWQDALTQTFKYSLDMANILFDQNVNVNFAPVLDVNTNPLNPIIGSRGRSFSSDPIIVFDQASEFVKAMHQKGIITALKHFPGHGSSVADSHQGLVDVTQTYDAQKELYPYKRFIEEGYNDLIMTTHVINGQIDKTQCKKGSENDPQTWCPGTMSYKTLTLLLREQLGFKGVIISDDMTMKAIADEYPLDVALEKSINAGVDMFIVANNHEDNTKKMINTIALLVKQGRVSEAQINSAYKHILNLKQRISYETN